MNTIAIFAAGLITGVGLAVLTALGAFMVAERTRRRAMVARPEDGRIEALITQQWKGVVMTLQELKAQVDANTQVEASAVTLIQGLASKIEEAKEDPAAVQALADELKASADTLSQAVTANTPAAPPSA